MFTVWAPSPPVPTMSTHSSASSTGVAWASISAARPVTSSADSPLARSATAKAATCTGVASPVMISRMAHTVSADERSSRARSRWNRAGQADRPALGAPLIRCSPADDGTPRVPAQQVRHHAGSGQRVHGQR
jgi:hypothetical protein